MSDGNVLRRLNESTDQIAPIAGVGGVPGSLANGIPGLSAEVDGSCGRYAPTDGIATDGSGNLLYADGQADLIRIVAKHTGLYYGQSMTAGHVYTVAGNGTPGYAGDGGPALQAQLAGPQDVATDSAGNMIITATGDDRIRVVAAQTGTYYGKAMTAGDIYTVYTGLPGSVLTSSAADHWGNLVIADVINDELYVLAERRGTYYGRAMKADGLYPIAPLAGNNTFSGASIAVDAAGNVIFSDDTSNLVQVVAASTGIFFGQSMTVGHVYTIAGNGSTAYNGDGIPAVTASMIPEGVAIDQSGNLVIGDGNNARLRVVAASTGTYYGQSMTAGDVYTVAGTGTPYLSGSGGAATAAELDNTGSSVVDAAGNILFCDARYSQNLAVHVLAARTGEFYGLFMYKGNVYTLPGAVATSLALDASGNVILGDTRTRVSDVLSVLAGKAGFFYKHWMIPGHIYPIPAAGNGAVTVDANGNFILGVPAQQDNAAINVFPVKNGTFYGQTMRAYHLYRLAGGGIGIGGYGNGVRALIARIGDPADLVFDSSGSLVFTDSGLDMIRVVAEQTGMFYGMAMKAGYVYNIAGTGGQGSSGDGGPAVDAQLGFPSGLTFDAAGNLVIADTINNKVRVVAENDGTFYGKAMHIGDIYTIAGTGTAAFGGDGGPAAHAWLDSPSAVTVEPGGNIIVSDTSSYRIRLITVG